MSFIDEAGRRRRELEDRHRPWRPLTLAGLLDRTAAQYPDRPFVIGEQAAFSYGQGRRARRGWPAAWPAAACGQVSGWHSSCRTALM